MSRLSIFQKSFAIPYFGIGSILNPRRADLVHGVADATSNYAISEMVMLFKNDANGRILLAERPRITSALLNSENVKTFSPNSFGMAYYNFMAHHEFSPDDRSPVRFIEDPNERFVMTRYREIHDFWHVLSGLPPTEFGEIALKWFEWEVTRLPVCLLSGVFGPTRLSLMEQMALMNIYIPWAKENAYSTRSSKLMTFYYEKHLHKDIDEIRSELNFKKAPSWKY